MRVIAGEARRLPLKTVKGLDTRPTTDRIKETLFNILSPYLADCRFLDLFSGSGAIGIEALSRGAGYCVFVDNQRAAAACIEENLTFTRLHERGNLIQRDALTALRTLEQEEAFDIIFMDPPYASDAEREVLSYLADSPLIHEDTLLIVEARLDKDFSFLDTLGYKITKEKRYKTNKHIFFMRSKS